MAVAVGRWSNRAAPWRHVDVVLVLTSLLIAGYGALMIYSSTQRLLEADSSYHLKRQILYIVVGVIAMVVTTLVDYRIVRDFAGVLYAGSIVLLILVKSPLGSSRKGAQAWFEFGAFQFQPSEFAKLVVIICLAAFCATHEGELDLIAVGQVLAMAALPTALVYLQPDLGSALVFVAILLGVLLVAGAKARHLAALLVLGVTLVVAVFQLGILKQYQIDRLSAFLDPQGDTQRSAYNLNQSQIAIGSGGVTGKGLFQGTQTNLSYVPEQHTDFIFTVVGEELGLAGSSLLLVLFAILVWRLWRIAALSKDLSGTLIGVGVLSMLVFQLFENMGMAMGIMPITGLTLPLMSFGGSSTVSTFVALGLVLNVHMRRFS